VKVALAAVVLAWASTTTGEPRKLSAPVVSGGYVWSYTEIGNDFGFVLFMRQEKKLTPDEPDAGAEAALAAAKATLKRDGDSPECAIDPADLPTSPPQDAMGWPFEVSCSNDYLTHQK
jgi:hypothetical protein